MGFEGPQDPEGRGNNMDEAIRGAEEEIRGSGAEAG